MSTMSTQVDLASCCLHCHATASPSGTPLQRCSACSKAQYCSVDCQRADFKQHRVLCDFIREANVFCRCPPTLNADREEFEVWIGNLYQDAAHSALKLNSPGALNRSHAFVLNMIANDKFKKGDDPSTRFKLLSAAAIPLDYVKQHMQWAKIETDKQGRINYLMSFPPLDAQARILGYTGQYSQMILYKPAGHPDAHHRIVTQKPYIDPKYIVPMDDQWLATMKKELEGGVGLRPFNSSPNDFNFTNLAHTASPFGGVQMLVDRRGRVIVKAPKKMED